MKTEEEIRARIKTVGKWKWFPFMFDYVDALEWVLES